MLLELKNLDSGYGFLQILWNVSLQVERGEYVCLIGPNGAGKSTTLKTIAGLLTPKKGDILFQGKPIGGLLANRVCETGVGFISEEANLFTAMTVRENLAMGAYTVRDKKENQGKPGIRSESFPSASGKAEATGGDHEWR